MTIDQPWQMTRPCKQCGHQGDGIIRAKNGQDVVYCGACGKYAGYNAPRTETGRAIRSVSSRPGIAPSKRSRILARDNYTCVLCHRNDAPLHIGHLISVDVGLRQGLSELELYDDENLAAMCDECNLGLGSTPVSLRFAVALLKVRLQLIKPKAGGDVA